MSGGGGGSSSSSGCRGSRCLVATPDEPSSATCGSPFASRPAVQGEERPGNDTAAATAVDTAPGDAAAAATATPIPASTEKDRDCAGVSESDPAPWQRSSAPPWLVPSASIESTEQRHPAMPPPALTGGSPPGPSTAGASASSMALGGRGATAAAAAVPTGSLLAGQLPTSFRRRASTGMLYGSAQLLHRLPRSPLPRPLGGPPHTVGSRADSCTLPLPYDRYSYSDERFTAGLSLRTLRLGSELSSDWGPAAAAAAVAAAAAGRTAMSVADGMAAVEYNTSALTPTTPAVPYGGFGAGLAGLGVSQPDTQQYMARAHAEVRKSMDKQPSPTCVGGFHTLQECVHALPCFMNASPFLIGIEACAPVPLPLAPPCLLGPAALGHQVTILFAGKHGARRWHVHTARSRVLGCLKLFRALQNVRQPLCPPVTQAVMALPAVRVHVRSVCL